MRSSRLVFIVVLLLASQASWASFTSVNQLWTVTQCTNLVATCTLTVSPTGAGHVIIVYTIMSGGGNGMTDVSDTAGSSYTICTVCESRVTTGTIITGAVGAVLDMAYTLSSVAGATSITATRRSTSAMGWRFGYWELSTSPGFRAEFDTGGSVVNMATGTTVVPGAQLTIAGSGEAILQTVLSDRASISVNQTDNAGSPNWTSLRNTSNYAVAGNVNAVNGTFYWRFGSAGAMIGSGIAFREVPNIIAPPAVIPHIGPSMGSENNVSFKPGVGISAGPPNGPPTITSVALTPATSTINRNQAVSFRATGTWSDGTTSDVTSACNWHDNSFSASFSNNVLAATDTNWVTQSNTCALTPGFCNGGLPNRIPYSQRGNPQIIHGITNGTAIVECQNGPYYGAPGNVSGFATIQIGPISITPPIANLNPATVGTPYSVSFTPTGGTPPYTYQDQSRLPITYFGLALSGNTISGTPIHPTGPPVSPATGTDVILEVTDTAGVASWFHYILIINPVVGLSVADNNYYDNPNGTCRNMGTGNDGPAALPTACFNTSPVNTPSPGATFSVPSSTYPTIQSAFDAIGGAIPCGSTIQIASPTTYDETLTYPAVACNASNWITVENNQVAALPPEGTRISPAWLGTASLPDRPAYNAPATPGVYLPKIRGTAYGQPALKFAQVASASGPVPSYVRFKGLYLAQPGPGSPQCTGHDCQTGWQSAIVESNCFVGGLVCPDHVIFDHVIIGPDDLTGNATYLVCDAIRLTGTSMAVVDSYIYEIGGSHGYCETHGVGFGNADLATQQGPYKIVNNYIEAGGENYFTGGGHSVSTPTNIQIRRNHLYKPENLWKPGASGYLGTPMLVKNLGEMKNALQTLIEGNIYQHSWYGHDAAGTPFTDQFGYGVLLNASSILTDVHRAYVQDVTFRYNFVQHVVRGMVIDSEDCRSSKLVGCGIYPPGSTPTLTERVSVHDNLFDDVSPKFFTDGLANPGVSNGFDGTGFSAVNSMQSVPPVGIFNSLTLNHNTVVSNSYRQNLQVASIAVSGTTATLTATTASTVVTTGQRLAVFGACTGFNDSNVTVLSVTQTTPALVFTYTTNATGTCSQGFISTLGDALGGAFNMDEGASDGALVNVLETGTLAQALVDRFPLGDATRTGFHFCVAVGNPTDCTSPATFTVYGLTGSLVCYNNNQSAATCPPSGTPATWTMVGTVACTGAGAGTVVGNASATSCLNGSQSVITWTHTITGLPQANTNASSYASYWLNTGPDPNPGWQNIVVTNNLVSGKVQLNAGNCQNGPATNSNDVLTLCGVLVTTGPGAYNCTCNLVAARQLTGQGNLVDVLPLTNKGITDFNSVGFVNYNSDNLGQGVANPGDLSLGSGSSYLTGLPGCDGLPTGANVSQIQTYTAGVP